ncbi:MAG: hypothetical protein C5B50_05455 [Verrucomicrobia bacterium]|nr:MAG: hypothetical protein C5B50_05455 [Verrucomicrobiota bacterium]
MSDQKLRVTRTLSAEQYEGSLWGIEVINFKWFALALLVALSLFAGLFYGLALGFLEAMQWALVPVLGCFLYLRFFHQGRPPGYLSDLLDSLVTRGHAKPPRKPLSHPFYEC